MDTKSTFNDERVLHYHEAFSGKDKHTSKMIIDSYKKNMSSTSRYPTNNDISKSYGCKFIGDRNNDDDVADFALRRWQMKRNAIIEFINETLAHLNTMIDNTPQTT